MYGDAERRGRWLEGLILKLLEFQVINRLRWRGIIICLWTFNPRGSIRYVNSLTFWTLRNHDALKWKRFTFTFFFSLVFESTCFSHKRLPRLFVISWYRFGLCVIYQESYNEITWQVLWRKIKHFIVWFILKEKDLLKKKLSIYEYTFIIIYFMNTIKTRSNSHIISRARFLVFVNKLLFRLIIGKLYSNYLYAFYV